MSEFLASTGTKVVINVADFEDAVNLKNAVSKQLATAGIKFDIDPQKTDIGSILGAIMQVDSSPEVNALLWPCLVRCTYGGHKITKQTFEPPDAREDYYDIVLACAKANLTPFFKSLISQLKELPIFKNQAKGVSQESA